jgi:hypothetical protein
MEGANISIRRHWILLLGSFPKHITNIGVILVLIVRKMHCSIFMKGTLSYLCNIFEHWGHTFVIPFVHTKHTQN